VAGVVPAGLRPPACGPRPAAPPGPARPGRNTPAGPVRPCPARPPQQGHWSWSFPLWCVTQPPGRACRATSRRPGQAGHPEPCRAPGTLPGTRNPAGHPEPCRAPGTLPGS